MIARPAYIALLGIALMTWGGGWIVPGVAIVGMSACMQPERTQ